MNADDLPRDAVAAGLSAIEKEAQATDAGAAAPPGGEPGAAPHVEPDAPPLTTAQQVDSFLLMVLGGAEKKFPALAELWTKDKRELFSHSLAPVLDKYDMAPSAFFGRWKAELWAAMVCLPMLWASAAIVRDGIEAARAAAAKDAGAGAGAAEPRAPG